MYVFKVDVQMEREGGKEEHKGKKQSRSPLLLMLHFCLCFALAARSR
jgi:hypothetical protein